MTIKPIITATLISALALATPLAAQTTSDQGSDTNAKNLSQIQPTPDLTADQVTEAQVSAFVDALMAIERVRVTYMPQIEATADDDARGALIDEANAAVVTAIDDVENMSVPDYMAIDKAAQEDEALNGRIMAQIQELQDGAGDETTTQ
ncbi:MAG: DUF4168 domain-containing protein [Rhodobacteraceae bacterium]|jgi:hypothetical protein|nr:DUF4168 domain-containing protein [Paracoccaceae bacterium]